MGFYFEQLDAYKKAMEFAKEVLAFTRSVPPNQYALADQLRRAAMSIGANIAEGWGRRHAKEKKHFYAIAMGSANECLPFLDFALFQDMISHDTHIKLRGLLNDIAMLVNGLYKSVE